ncbi:Bro-N domain-containing protein [Campylobacter jejuni]|uniref:BRO-N domain-containing protein n=1 Tax=Campylobacter jejuni TaxID=197 RepID=UPI0021C66146|nr:BRO family protein [Campylobacter jejuni]
MILENSLQAEVVNNSNIVLFENEELGQVRVALDENNEPLFCLSDICKILDIQDTYKVKQAILREFELSTLSVDSFDTGFGIKEFTMITEPQLYFILMRSDKPNAKHFRHWVTKEVLPSIRKKGYYGSINKNNTTIDSNIYYKELCDRLLIENKELKSENINLKRHINGELYLEFLNKLNTFSKIHFKNSKSKALDYIYKTIAIEFMCPTYSNFDISDLESDPRYLRYAIDLCNDAISNNFLSRKLI